MDKATAKPRTVFLAQTLFFLNGLIWLALGVVGLVRLAGNPSVTLWLVAILMFGNVGAMLIAGLWLGQRSRWAFFFALVVLVVNILLTFTDQVGFWDILTVLIDLGLLGFLLYDCKNYFSGKGKIDL